MVADSLIMGVNIQVPFRVRYEISCDTDYRVRCVELHLLSGTRQAVALRGDGTGNWTDACGTPLPDLEGCLDVDISVTPFTNTLTIRRMGLQPGETADLLVAYLAVPEMRVEAVQQRYTCVSAHPQGGVYRYEALFRNTITMLPVDAEGFVIDYPQRFRRVWTGKKAY
jgi:hypothetical protein